MGKKHLFRLYFQLLWVFSPKDRLLRLTALAVTAFLEFWSTAVIFPMPLRFISHFPQTVHNNPYFYKLQGGTSLYLSLIVTLCILSCDIGHMHSIFEEVFIQVLWSFLYWIVWAFMVEFEEFPIYSAYCPLSDILSIYIFFHYFISFDSVNGAFVAHLPPLVGNWNWNWSLF